MTNTKKRLFLYSVALLLMICITIYSKERRKHVKENSYTSVNGKNKTEQVLILTKFNTNDNILAQKSIRLIELMLNTNYSNFTYDNFYWCVGVDALGYTMYYDIKPQKERAIILIDYKLFPPKRNYFYAGDVVEFGSSLCHELHHYYYLSTEQEMEDFEYTIVKRKIALIHQKVTDPRNPKIRNQLDVLLSSVGL